MLPEGKGFISDLLALVPELKQVAQLEIRSPFLLDSSSTAPEHWIELGALVSEHMDAFDGFVITHGTDTMSYTAAALSFMLGNLKKPVVLTGAQRPLTEVRSDARGNLLDSVEVATRGAPEVMVCFGGLVLRGNRSRKRSLSDYRAFESPNYPVLGEAGARLVLHNHRMLKPKGSFTFQSNTLLTYMKT